MIDNTLYTTEEIHKLAIETAALSPCKKRKVGAILTVRLSAKDNLYNIISKGYNYSLDGESCECEKGKTKDTVMHAEAAALLNFDLKKYKDCYLHMFITYEPCNSCKAALLEHKISYEVVGEFMKFDKNKPRMHLVPASLNLACAEVLTYGAKKYKVNNWRKIDNLERYINALLRHFDAWREGEDYDKESGLHHLHHVAANLSFLIELKDLPKITNI